MACVLEYLAILSSVVVHVVLNVLYVYNHVLHVYVCSLMGDSLES